jgi:hypothetical protein
MVEMMPNGSGIVNKGIGEGCCPEATAIEGRRVEAAEIDEMRSAAGVYERHLPLHLYSRQNPHSAS